jgi:hypothetical protein
MVFNATFNNISVISWRSVFSVEETGENHWPDASHWRTWSHTVVSSTPRHERDSKPQRRFVVIDIDCIGSCKSNYRTTTNTAALYKHVYLIWVIICSGRRNVMNHIASRETIFGRSFIGMRGIFLPWVILRRERHHDHIWIFEHSIFLWRQFRGGVMPLYGKWVCLWPYMGTPQRRRFLGCIKLITLYYLYLI